MGFPVGCTGGVLPNYLVRVLFLLGFIRNMIITLFRFLDISDLVLTDNVWPETHTRDIPEYPPVSALLIREFLPVTKFSDLLVVGRGCSGDRPESCAVCLCEFEGREEIRWLKNCKHVFHRGCLDRWMDHDQKTCPLCRTHLVPDEMKDDFNQRLWAYSEEP